MISYDKIQINLVLGELKMNAEKISIDRFYYEKRSQKRNTVGNQHYHNYFEIYYLESGSCRYFIDEETYDVKAGDLVLIPEGIIHKTMYEDNVSVRRLIYCNSDYIPKSVIPVLPSFLYVYRNADIKDSMLSIFDSLEKEYAMPDTFSDEAIVSNLRLLFFLLARNTTSNETASISGSDYTTQTIAYIKENFGGELRLSDLASKCAITPEHLSRVFKRDTGLGISEYINLVRFQKAQELLLSPSAPTVAQIAYSCGFNDSNYFSLRFKKMYGVSPLSYRKKKRAYEKNTSV